MRYRTWLLTAALLSLFASGQAFGAVVTIENPKGLPVDEGEVNLLYTMTCREIAEAYHVRNYKDLQVPVTLVLGGDDERYVIDQVEGYSPVVLLRRMCARLNAA